IVVGEVRGAEALDMLQAMNTGHDGSLSTIHANTPRDALSRVETMVLMAGYDLPVRAIRQQVSSALDLLVHLERLEDGSRRVTAITEVQRMESDVITLQELFAFKVERVTAERAVIGSLRPTGLRPTFMHKFAKRGVEMPNDIFAVVPVGGATVKDFGVVLVIDTSISMRGGPLKNALNAARAFALQRNPKQQFGIVTFNQSPTVLLPLTTDQAQIDAALAKTPALN